MSTANAGLEQLYAIARALPPLPADAGRFYFLRHGQI